MAVRTKEHRWIFFLLLLHEGARGRRTHGFVFRINRRLDLRGYAGRRLVPATTLAVATVSDLIRNCAAPPPASLRPTRSHLVGKLFNASTAAPGSNVPSPL